MPRDYRGQWVAKCPDTKCPGSIHKKGRPGWWFFQCSYCAEMWESFSAIVEKVMAYDNA